MSKAALYHALSRLLPEGSLKGKLRLWYYAATGKLNRHPVTGQRLPFTLRYQPLKRRFFLCFDQGPFAGAELVFPPYYDAVLHPQQVTAPWAFLWGAGTEVESYFLGPDHRAGDLVIDAGACPGDYCLLASSIVGATGRVIALEADRYSADYLRHVVELNHGANCDVRYAALAGESGQIALTNDEYGARLAPVAAGLRGIPAVTFDQLIEECDPTGAHRHILKMDIEGGEADIVPAILAGRHTPDLWLIAAYHPDRRDQQPTHVRLAPLLTEAGYTCVMGPHTHQVLFAWR